MKKQILVNLGVTIPETEKQKQKTWWKPVKNEKMKPSGILGKLLGCPGRLLGSPGELRDVRQAIGMSYMSGWFLWEVHVGKYTIRLAWIRHFWPMIRVRKISDWYPVHSSSMILTWAKIAHVNPLSNVQRWLPYQLSSYKAIGSMNGRFLWYI